MIRDRTIQSKDNSLTKIKNQISTPLILQILMVILSFSLIFVTLSDAYVDLGFHKIYHPITKLFNTTQGDFPGFEVISVLFVLIMFLIYHFNFKVQESHIKRFIVITTVFVIVALLNPYNHLKAGLLSFLLFKLTASTIFGAILSIVILTLRNVDFEDLAKKFFIILLFAATCKASLDIFVFISGYAPRNLFYRKVTTIGGDILIWLAILHTMTFALFLYTKKKLLLIPIMLIFVTMVFSYQRTAILISAIFDLVFYALFTLLLSKKMGIFFRNLALGFFLVIISFYLLTITNVGQELILRYGSAIEFTGLIYLPDNIRSSEYSDSGHLEQSLKTTQFFLENSDLFWGGGLNRRNENYLQIEGQSYGGVHNNIVAMWQYFGMPGVFYYLFLFIYFLYFFFRTIKDRNKLSLYRYLIMAVSLYFIIRAITGWFSGDFIFLTFQNVFQIVFLVSITKLYNYKADIRLAKIYN